MHLFWFVYFFMLGATFASFYNVVGIRSIDHISLTRRSMCPKCNHKLRFIDVIPLVGFIINRGHCHFCKEKIHIKYFLIEVLGGLLYALSFQVYGLSLYTLILMVLFSLIMIFIVSYYEHKLVLNKLVYYFLPILMILQIINDNFISSIQGFAVCIICTYILSLSEKGLSKYVLYTSCLGLVLGFKATILFLVISIIAIVLAKLFKKLPKFVYIVSYSCMISIFAYPYINELLLKIMG